MKILKSIYRYITTRYTKVQLLAIAIVIAFGFFITDSSLFARFSYDAKIMELNGQIEHYRGQTEHDKKQLEQLHSNKDDIEKFARENYLMKKPSEDIFVIE